MQQLQSANAISAIQAENPTIIKESGGVGFGNGTRTERSAGDRPHQSFRGMDKM